MSVVGEKLQPTLFERSRPGRGDGVAVEVGR